MMYNMVSTARVLIAGITSPVGKREKVAMYSNRSDPAETESRPRDVNGSDEVLPEVQRQT